MGFAAGIADCGRRERSPAYQQFARSDGSSRRRQVDIAAVDYSLLARRRREDTNARAAPIGCATDCGAHGADAWRAGGRNRRIQSQVRESGVETHAHRSADGRHSDAHDCRRRNARRRERCYLRRVSRAQHQLRPCPCANPSGAADNTSRPEDCYHVGNHRRQQYLCGFAGSAHRERGSDVSRRTALCRRGYRSARHCRRSSLNNHRGVQEI